MGAQNRTERSVSPGVDADQVGHVPASPVDPEVLRHRNQSFADGPVGHDKTRRPVGTERMHAVNDSDRPTAGGPVGQLFNSDPLYPSGMPFLDELYQPLAVGPVGQPFITGPLGNHVSEPDCRRTNRINSGPWGSTGVLDPVNQTGSDVQTDHLSIGTINGPASSGDTPPSSDSGVHSWKEQWENMSENSTNAASEQTVRSNCIAALSDFSDDMEETGVRRLLGCRIPGCKCNGRVVNMRCGSDGLPDMFNSECETNASNRVLQTEQESPKLVLTVQPILVADDVIPIPWDRPVDHERRSIIGGGVRISDEEVFNRRYRPIRNSVMQWDSGVLPETSDPEFAPCVARLVFEALERDEDALVGDEYPELIKCMVKSFRMLRSKWDEHDARLREQQTICTTPSCQCHRRYELMFRQFANGMETDDSESEEIADWNKRSYGMSNTNSYSEGVAPRTYTLPPPPKEETRPEVCKTEET